MTRDPRVTTVTTLLLMVGLPGAGKTTRAKEIEATHWGLRLTPDEWMIPLFGDSDAGGKRDVLEGRLVSVALRALRLGTSVVLDFGLWGRDERSALRWLARSLGRRPGGGAGRRSGQWTAGPRWRTARPARARRRDGTAARRAEPRRRRR